MSDFINYITTNIPLFCLSFVVLFLAIRNINVRRRESIYFIVFTALVLYLSVAVFMERYDAHHGIKFWATFFTATGYIVRPVLLYIFCLLANMEKKRSQKFYILWGIPLLVNMAVYILPLFIDVKGISTLVFSYAEQIDGTLKFTRGGPLNFFSHAISFGYLLLLFYVSVLRFYGKHRRDAMVLSLCIIFIFITVLAEVLTGRNDLLNIVCEICAIINYIFITSVNASRDVLTNLYDRRTFYEDSARYKNKINGIVQIDMNGLKNLNDKFGHTKGDEALNTISKVFSASLQKDTMFAYRLSGDEFVILMIQGKKEYLDNTIEQIRSLIGFTEYSIAIGSYFIDKGDQITFEEALKEAELLMYADKSKFYISNHIDRRRT